MRLAVFGPTGKTGQHVVQQALGRGYAVYAVARRPESVPARHKNLTVIGGDVLSPDGWASQLAGVDAIISALGGGMQRAPTTIYSAGTSAVVSAMTRNGIDRIAVISAEPAGDWHEAGALKRLLAYPVLQFLFGATYDDMRRMERMLAQSAVDWTVLRPPYLTDRTPRGRYRLGADWTPQTRDEHKPCRSGHSSAGRGPRQQAETSSDSSRLVTPESKAGPFLAALVSKRPKPPKASKDSFHGLASLSARVGSLCWRSA